MVLRELGLQMVNLEAILGPRVEGKEAKMAEEASTERLFGKRRMRNLQPERVVVELEVKDREIPLSLEEEEFLKDLQARNVNGMTVERSPTWELEKEMVLKDLGTLTTSILRIQPEEKP